MGKTRVYCILSDGTNIYVPVKAEYSPYPDRITGEINPAYLGLMPNFFGGAVERVDRGNCATALFREINQESQGKINPEVINISQDNNLYYANIGDKYYFWLVDISAERVSGFDGAGSKLMLSDDPDLFEAKFREMQCILKIPVDNLASRVRNIVGTPDDEILASLFLKECSMKYDEEENFFINRLNNEWSRSETKKAFAKLVRRLTGLPV